MACTGWKAALYLITILSFLGHVTTQAANHHSHYILAGATDAVVGTLTDSGAISGRVTQSDGSTPVAGASVKVSQGATTVATTTTNVTGDYSFSGINAGTYTVEASAAGYGNGSLPTTVTGGATTTANFSLDAIIGGPITYIYDELGRLVSAVTPTEAVIYSYDAVGNLLSVSRRNSSQVSIIEVAPDIGPVGAPVTIYGTGFSATANQNTVSFNGANAAVISSTQTQIVTSVPSGATTGAITITAPGGSATSSTSFTVGGEQGAPTVTGFIPNVGTSGIAVTITGTNFETMATNNKVKFYGVISVVATATVTSITSSVPTGATSGRLSVTTPAGTATSGDFFFIPPAPYAASDVEVASVINYGQSKPITISSPNKVGMLVFEGIANKQISLNVSGVTVSNSSISIYRPDGTIFLTPVTVGTGGTFIDQKTLAATGVYVILIDPSSTNTGGMTLTLYDATDVAGSITPGGTAVSVTTTAPGQNARLTFAGTAGQRVSLKVTSQTMSMGGSYHPMLSIIKPDGANLFSPESIYPSGGFIDAQTLPAGGTYTVLIDPRVVNTGNMNLILYDVVDATAAVTPGGSAVTVTTTVPGQDVRLTFAGTAGQRVSLKLTADTLYGQVSILKPDGTTLPTSTTESGGVKFTDAVALPASGTYTILINPSLDRTGGVTAQLYDVPSDASAAITPGGSAVSVTTTVPGQNAQMTFAGTAGQRVSLRTTTGTLIRYFSVSVLKPDGTTLVSPNQLYPGGGFIDTWSLPVTGTYIIFHNPSFTDTGSMTFTLYDVTDAVGTITVGGPSVTVGTTTPGQNAGLTFSGTAGQQVTVRLTGNTIGQVNVKLLKPDGSVLTQSTSSAGSFNLTTQTLSVAGTYTISIDPNYTNVGGITVSVTNP